ncbi:GreA/GreB family elongation factor [Myxococcota bacterium]|nr:GreA/GreB family elongation factor [Myxococcota bacterium]
MAYYFLENDFSHLRNSIQEIKERILEIGQEMGMSCQEGAETFHDNFAYEDGERQQYMWSKRLVDLQRIAKESRVIRPEEAIRQKRVCIGAQVMIEDVDTEKTMTVCFGSYMTFSKGEISYASPLGRILMGAVEGDLREGLIAGTLKTFLVRSIS